MTLAVCLLATSAFAKSAAEIVKKAEFRGGVAVLVGTGDGTLAAEIHRQVPNSLVHVLVAGTSDLQPLRSALAEKSTDGKVTMGRWDGKRIPFVEDFVNLLVIPADQTVSDAEVQRVLAPGGWAINIHANSSLASIGKNRPEDLDDWTHYLHGVDNNPVSKDKHIKPPLYHLKWVGSPRWSRHHDVMSSVSACVSADNKVFYIFDEGPTFSPFLPPQWKLIARDAFNGTILWKHDIPKWFPNLHGLKSGPANLPRRLVASHFRSRVYVTLGIESPVSEIDSDTGEVLRVLKDTEGTEEILHEGSMLYLLRDRNPNKVELSKYPLAGSRSWAIREKTITNIDLVSGQVIWEVTSPWVAPLSMAMDGQNLYFYNGEAVQALSRTHGRTVWTSKPLPLRANTSLNFGPSLVVHKGVVVYTGGENLKRGNGSREAMYGLAANDGRKLWEAYHPASGYKSPEDLFVIGGCVWSGDVTAHRWAGDLGATGVVYGTDLKGGKTEHEFAPDKDAYWFHHRCHMAKATESYLLTSRTGIEFVDLKNKSWTLHHWVRGACLYGIMPANGMIYAPQHPCACYIGGKLFGFNALAPKSAESLVLAKTPDAERRLKGPAFSKSAAPPELVRDPPASDWPTYRRDNRRSGAAPTTVAAELKERWSVTLPGVTTPPVMSDGKVLVSLKNQQGLYALDADTGETLYRFFPEGRIDSPPTVYSNRVYFGSTDGHVYCLRLEDGALVWKYQAAPSKARHMYFENLESTHPVHGTVLVRDNKVYTVCGRSMFVDGGMRFLILDAWTGKKIAEHVMDDTVPETGEPLQLHHEFLNMPVAMPDLLSCNEDKIFMRFQEFDLDGKRLKLDFSRKLYAKDIADKNKSFETLSDQKGTDAHVFSGTGFLDDSWWHRSYWIHGKNYGSGWPGYYLAGRSVPAGRILSFDKDGIFGWGRMKQYFRWTKQHQYMLFGTDYDYQQKWARAVPILVRAMVKTDDQLHLFGPEELVNQEAAQKSITMQQTQKVLARQAAAMRGEHGGTLLRVNAADGTIQSGYRLATTPVFDGMASADGRLYIALSDGTVNCLGSEGKPLEQIAAAEIAQYNANAELKAPPVRKPGTSRKPKTPGKAKGKRQSRSP